MTTETEEILWIASQENKLIPREIILFGINHKRTLFDLLSMDISNFNGIDEDIIKKFEKNREDIPFDLYHIIYEKMQKEKINILTYCDPFFPKFFKNNNDKTDPVLLFYQGKKLSLKNTIAVVGTRNCSTHAIEYARDLGRDLATLGYIVVGGLARGIDAAAHRGAISVKGKTVSVLPWIYDPYPPEHERLLEEIKQNGSVLSEYFFKSKKMDKYKFIERNRIISGISEVIVAVESAYSGGTRWQVEMALSQKRLVIAMEPEQANKIAYDGFKQFVMKGAKPASSVDEAMNMIKKFNPIEQPSLSDYDLVNDIDELEIMPLKSIN